MTWTLISDDYDVLPIGTVSDEIAEQLAGYGPLDDTDDWHDVPGSRWRLYRLGALGQLSRVDHPPMLTGYLSAHWSTSPEQIAETKTELVLSAEVVGLPEEHQREEEERPQLVESIHAFESSYTLGARYQVEGLDLAAVQAHFDEVKLHFAADPAAYVIEAWVRDGNRLATALGFLIRPENMGLTDRLLARAGEVVHTRGPDVEKQGGWHEATCACGWTGRPYQHAGDLASSWAQHKIDTDPETIRALLNSVED